MATQELLAWRAAGRVSCKSKTADPNVAAGGCRYFGKTHHPTDGGAFTVRNGKQV